MVPLFGFMMTGWTISCWTDHDSEARRDKLNLVFRAYVYLYLVPMHLPFMDTWLGKKCFAKEKWKRNYCFSLASSTGRVNDISVYCNGNQCAFLFSFDFLLNLVFKCIIHLSPSACMNVETTMIT